MIKKFPDPILDEQSKAVSGNLDQEQIDSLISRMRRACWSVNGFGIAAIQIGEPFRILGYLSKSSKDLEWIIDPEIIGFSGRAVYEEGCLSVPGYFWNICRAEKITLKYKDKDLVDKVKTFKEMESRVIQHEIDHLDGLSIPDFLSNPDFINFIEHFQSDKPMYEYNSPDIDMR
jgi:peptide deformylase